MKSQTHTFNILELIDQFNKTHPHGCAIQDEDKMISYSNLFQWSNQLAHFLIEKGVTKDSIIALIMSAGWQSFIAILAILKVGAAYVPIDITHPLDRKRYILETLNPHLILSLKSDNELLLGDLQNIVFLDQLPEIVFAFSSQALPVREINQDLAYIIYTSGSTGNPKGVMISYQSLCHLYPAIREVISLNATDRLLQFASIGFDASIVDWLAALTQGATLCCLANKNRKYDLKNVMQKYSNTIVVLPPTLASLLDPKDLPSLKTLIVAGEACHNQVIIKWKDHVRLINFYGPTEATIWSTYFCYENNQITYPSTTIGKPIPGVNTYILNAKDELCKAEEIGELLLEGKTLSHGYYKYPEGTSRAFIYLPHISNQRLYRTGDLVYRLSDGNIVYHGRKDDQIKIYGNRVEIAEIEHVLHQHRAINKAIVQAYEIQSGKCQLIAFYTLRNKQSALKPQTILRHLKAKLPSFMIPNHFLLLETIPLNSQGKVDKKRLSEIFSAHKQSYCKTASHPKDEVEAVLMKSLNEILNCSVIHEKDNIFHLGLDSLGILNLILEIENKLDFKLSLDSIQNHPNVQKLAAFIRKYQKQKSQLALFHIKKSRSKQAVFFLPPAGGLSFSYIPLKSHLSCVNLYALNNPYFGDHANQFPNVEMLAKHYISLMNPHYRSFPYILVGWSFGGTLSFEMACQLANQGYPPKCVVLIDSYCLNGYATDDLEGQHLNNLLDYYRVDQASPLGIRLAHELSHNALIAKKYSPKVFEGDAILIKSTVFDQRLDSIYETIINHSTSGWPLDSANSFILETIPVAHHAMFHSNNLPIIGPLLNRILKKYFNTAK